MCLDFYVITRAPDYLCAYKHGVEQKSLFNCFYYSRDVVRRPSSANGLRDAKTETLVDGVADFRHVFIYSEHEIASFKLFATLKKHLIL